MTHHQALEKVAGLRNGGLSKRQIDAWVDALLEWHPEQIHEAAVRVAKGWSKAQDFQIYHLIQALPAVGAVAEERRGFWFGNDGRWGDLNGGKDEREIAKVMGRDEIGARELGVWIADQGENGAPSPQQATLAELVSPGALADWAQRSEKRRAARQARERHLQQLTAKRFLSGTNPHEEPAEEDPDLWADE